MYKPRAFKRQFAVAHDGREKTIDSDRFREGAREARYPPPPPAPLFLERCVTSQKRLRGRLRPVSQGLDPALMENVGKQIYMANQKGKQGSKGGPMVRTLASHKCGIRIPKSKQYVG